MTTLAFTGTVMSNSVAKDAGIGLYSNRTLGTGASSNCFAPLQSAYDYRPAQPNAGVNNLAKNGFGGCNSQMTPINRENELDRPQYISFGMFNNDDLLNRGLKYGGVTSASQAPYPYVKGRPSKEGYYHAQNGGNQYSAPEWYNDEMIANHSRTYNEYYNGNSDERYGLNRNGDPVERYYHTQSGGVVYSSPEYYNDETISNHSRTFSEYFNANIGEGYDESFDERYAIIPYASYHYTPGARDTMIGKALGRDVSQNYQLGELSRQSVQCDPDTENYFACIASKGGPYDRRIPALYAQGK